MYKVITHNIKEEHFDHPLTADIGLAKHTGHTGTPPGNVMAESGTISSVGGQPMKIVARPKKASPMAVITQPPSHNGNIGNVKVKMYDMWDNEENYMWGQFDAWGDLDLHGSGYITGNLYVDGTFHGRGSTATVTVMETNPTTNTWDGHPGDLCSGPGYMYLCVSKDTWIRWATQATW